MSHDIVDNLENPFRKFNNCVKSPVYRYFNTKVSCNFMFTFSYNFYHVATKKGCWLFQVFTIKLFSKHQPLCVCDETLFSMDRLFHLSDSLSFLQDVVWLFRFFDDKSAFCLSRFPSLPRQARPQRVLDTLKCFPVTLIYPKAETEADKMNSSSRQWQSIGQTHYRFLCQLSAFHFSYGSSDVFSKQRRWKISLLVPRKKVVLFLYCILYTLETVARKVTLRPQMIQGSNHTIASGFVGWNDFNFDSKIEAQTDESET